MNDNVMLIYELYIDFNGEYARLSPYEELNEKQPEPMKFIWNSWGADNKKIADFIPTFFSLVAKESIVDTLVSLFIGITKKQIEVVDLVTDSKKKSRLKWYPVEYPVLAKIEMTKRVSLLSNSTVDIEEEIDKGKVRRILRNITGVAQLEDGVIIPRESGKGFFIAKNEIDNFDFFHPEDSCICLCTEKVKRFVENKGYTNVYFLEAGEIVIIKK